MVGRICEVWSGGYRAVALQDEVLRVRARVELDSMDQKRHSLDCPPSTNVLGASPGRRKPVSFSLLHTLSMAALSFSEVRPHNAGEAYKSRAMVVALHG